MNKMDYFIVYTFIILNSISGWQIRGVAVNAIVVFSFAVYIFMKYLVCRKQNEIRFAIKNPFLLFIIFSALSCLLSMIRTYSLPHFGTVLNFAENCVIYLLVFVFLYNSNNRFIGDLKAAFKRGLVLAARIQAVWGIAQIMFLYGAGININQVLFIDILQTTNSRDWIMGFYTGNIWNMRITGLNFENSMFALVVCIGMVLEEKHLWKLFLMVTVVLSLSRTGWIMVIGYLVILGLRGALKSGGRFHFTNLLKLFLAVFAMVTTLFLLYRSSPSIARQINNIYLRLTDSAALNVSASRHILYYPYGFYLWLLDSDIFQMLLGYGMRCSGLAFSGNEAFGSLLGIREAFTGAWAVECDVIGLLLGGGILTFGSYYMMGIRGIKSRQVLSDAMLIILIGGISYHYHSISYVIFVFLISMLPDSNISEGDKSLTVKTSAKIMEQIN